MNVVQIREAAKKAGFIIVVETHATVVIKNKRLGTKSIKIDGCTEKNLAALLAGKKPTKVKNIKTEKKVEKVLPEPIESKDDGAEATTTLTTDALESINGIGPKTATEILSIFTTEEGLKSALSGDEFIDGMSDSTKDKLKAHFGI
jgi:5'-3' exonuclease